MISHATRHRKMYSERGRYVIKAIILCYAYGKVLLRDVYLVWIQLAYRVYTQLKGLKFHPSFFLNVVETIFCVEKMRVYDDAYQKVVQKQMCVWMSIARINFVGLPRSGKTCTLRRLMGQMINLLEEGHGDVELPSTGIAERRTAFLRNIQTSTAISKSMWSSPDLLEQIGTIFELAHVIAHKSKSIIIVGLIMLLRCWSSICNKFLIEKWFPLQSERAHSLYFLCAR